MSSIRIRQRDHGVLGALRPHRDRPLSVLPASSGCGMWQQHVLSTLLREQHVLYGWVQERGELYTRSRRRDKENGSLCTHLVDSTQGASSFPRRRKVFLSGTHMRCEPTALSSSNKSLVVKKQLRSAFRGFECILLPPMCTKETPGIPSQRRGGGV